MPGRRSGLGRGLDALLPTDRPQRGYAELPLDRIEPNPDQPRRQFDEAALAELAASIQEVGLLQPIVVRPSEEEGRYRLVVGERRWRAARLAGLETIAAVIREDSEPATTLTEALIENLQRTDLTPLEEAAAYRELLEEYGLTHEEIARRVGRSRSSVSNTLRLLQLPAPIQGMVERGELSAGHARALLGLEDPAFAVHVAERAVAEGWSVRRVEDAVRLRRRDGDVRARRAPAVRPAAVIELEERLGEALGTGVRIDYRGRGGRLVVRFSSVDDLERIYRRLLG